MGEARPLVFTHLFPNATAPVRGVFVRDEVDELQRFLEVAVVSPMRWLPPYGPAGWAAERNVVGIDTANGVPVWRPRLPALPGGPVSLRLEARLWGWFAERAARPAVAAHRPTVIHGHFALPDGVAALALARHADLPFVLTVHGSDVLRYPAVARTRRMVSRVLAAADVVIAGSDLLANAVDGLTCGSARVSVIPVGVGARVTALKRDNARHTLGLPRAKTIVLWLGRLVEVKRPMLALDVAAELARRGEDVDLCVAGGGPLARHVEERVRAQRLTNVRILGPLMPATVAPWLSAVDVLLITSESEGASLVAKEALVCGTPVVGTDVGLLGELAAAGYPVTVCPGTSAALTDALLNHSSHEPSVASATNAVALLATESARAVAHLYRGLM